MVEQADNGQTEALGGLVASVKQLQVSELISLWPRGNNPAVQEELRAQKALVAKQVVDTSKLHVSSYIQKTHHREV